MEALLDACSISYLFQAGQKDLLRRAASVLRIHLVETVVNELQLETGWGHGVKKLVDELVGGGRCEVHCLVLGSEEATLFNRLRAGAKTSKDQGELESIALAAYRPDLVFVTEDHGAMRWALNELPGFPARVTRTAAWLRTSDEQGAKLDKSGLMRWAEKVPSPLPQWWQSWLDR